MKVIILCLITLFSANSFSTDLNFSNFDTDIQLTDINKSQTNNSASSYFILNDSEKSINILKTDGNTIHQFFAKEGQEITFGSQETAGFSSSSDSFSITLHSVLKSFKITDETFYDNFKSTDSFQISGDKTPSVISVGTSANKCVMIYNIPIRGSSSISINTKNCPVQIKAVSDTNEIYQYTSNLNGQTMTMDLSDPLNPSLSVSQNEFPMLNLEGNQVGYFKVNAETLEWVLLDNNKQSFKSN